MLNVLLHQRSLEVLYSHVLIDCIRRCSNVCADSRSLCEIVPYVAMHCAMLNVLLHQRSLEVLYSHVLNDCIRRCSNVCADSRSLCKIIPYVASK